MERRSASSDEKSKSAERHCRTFTGSKSWLSIFLTSSSSKGSTRPVTPNVPSRKCRPARPAICPSSAARSEEHTSELQSRENLVCRLLLEKKKKTQNPM